MPLFRVELESVVPCDTPRNPFAVREIFNLKTRRTVRMWEFEAADEADVRRLLAEAHEQDVPNVRGYRLRSIESILL